MIIGIDGNEANVGKRVGVSEYAFELLLQLATINKQQSTNNYIIYLKDNPRDDLPKERDGWRYRVVGPRPLWTQIGLPVDLYMHKPRPDVFFSPTHYAPRFSPAPSVISIMDLSYIHFPQLFKRSDLYQLRNWTAYSVSKATKVLTISQSSKDDIIRIYVVPQDRVVVTYPGVKQMANGKWQMVNIKKKYGIEGDYILFVGTLQPRKNVVRLVDALSKLKEKDLTLVVVGKRGWLFEEILAAPKKFGVEDRVKFLDFVPDEDLPTLYAQARLFILPSLYEGFGLPVLEAMANGCPVITSNISSLPEAGGDAALYIEPSDVNDIAEKIGLLLTNEKLRKELIKKGKEQVKKFSWEKTARATLNVLEEVARE